MSTVQRYSILQLYNEPWCYMVRQVKLDWVLMALSARIGYLVPLVSILQLESENNWRKLTMLRVGNTENKPSQ